jgi:hypothetical protein
MSEEHQPIHEPEEMELRESAAEWMAAGSAAVTAATSLGTFGLVVRRDRREEAREQAMLDAPLGNQEYEPGFDSDASYDPGFGEPPVDFGVEGEDGPIDFGVG